ncbi:lectin-like domain-containing protein [Companilactobacillus nuruki]|uniref:DUF11 domain-containing protein n=1 Tax=Companilactobacillus nuruki TaxID=1993540 RepID=A0A2N7AVX6_9LACO|nr:hypothetical protein [Companilactobacillus nuruki]PMD72284.1 hypothetical protein CBP76_03870 [Companilactobacillus nuruki]
MLKFLFLLLSMPITLILLFVLMLNRCTYTVKADQIDDVSSIESILNINSFYSKTSTKKTHVGKNKSTTQSIPAPPTSGPLVKGNFSINGYTPHQDGRYANMEIISDGKPSKQESMWYKNSFAINRPFETKFYIYMRGRADGLTFTIQGQGKKALGVRGEALAVYGNFRAKRYTGYVRKALSLEFDPYANGDYSDRNEPIRGPHIAYTNPSDVRKLKNGGYSLKHFNTISAPSLNNGKWHQVIVKWNPSGKNGVMDASFDGKDLGEHKVPLSQFGKGPYYWGFTGSTGAEKMQGAVAYTEVIQQPTLNLLVRNVSSGQTDFTETTDAKVGDELEYKVVAGNYKQNGLGNLWSNVVINDNLPNGITTLDGKNNISLKIGDIGVGKSFEKYFRAKVTVDKNIPLGNTVQANGSNYYQSPTNLDSNNTVINVKKQIEPRAILSVNDKIYNESYPNDHNNDNTQINNVKKGDDIKYTSIISNTKSGSKFNNGKYTFEIPDGTNIKKIQLNGKTLNLNSDYTIDNNIGRIKVTLNSLNIPGNSEADINIWGVIGKNSDKLEFDTIPSISGNNADGSINNVLGNKLLINYGDDSIVIDPKDISFGAHIFNDEDDVFERTVDTISPNPVLKFIDKRRDKKGIKILVNQNDYFRKEGDESQKLYSKIRYYNGDHYQSIFQNPTLVYQTSDGQTPKDIIWSDHNGLLLHENQKSSVSGFYSTKITWTDEDSI